MNTAASRAHYERIDGLVKQLRQAFEAVPGGVDYQILIESYDADDEHFYGAEECNNWERSWC